MPYIRQITIEGPTVMPTPSPATAARPLEAFNAPLHIGAVTLAVHDLDLMTTFYQQMLGLDVIEKSAARTTLGNDGMALVHLDHRPNATRENPKSAGLFHTAFLVPTRAGLGAWLLQASERKLQFTGMSDHQVSEALYLDDPEHNGIEVYVDRDRKSVV